VRNACWAAALACAAQDQAMVFRFYNVAILALLLREGVEVLFDSVFPSLDGSTRLL
jgi:hypothetical protein